MNPSLRSLLLLLAACGLDACASAPAPAPPAAADRPRRRRRRPAAATAAPDAGVPDAGAPDAGAPDAGAPDAGAPDDGAPEPTAAPPTPAGPPDGLSLVPTVRRANVAEPRANAPSMGTPVVASGASAERALVARWTGPRGARRIVCEGEGNPQRASMQSPYDPTNAMIVRAFLPIERQVIACAPPVDREGRVPVRMVFGGNGLPQEVSLSEEVNRAQGLCLGTALCSVRIGAFRAPTATVSYAIVAAMATDATPAESD